MIEAAFERRAEFNPATAPVALCEAVQEALDLLELCLNDKTIIRNDW